MTVTKAVTKAGSAPLKKVGHTFSGKFGSEPNAKRRGIPAEPTTQTFGGK